MKSTKFSIFILSLMTQNAFAHNWWEDHEDNECPPGMELDEDLDLTYYNSNCKEDVQGAHISHCCEDTICVANTYVDGSHQCVDCPSRRYRDFANISATIAEESPNVVCDETICDTTKRTVNGKCQECASGAQMSSTTNAFLNQNKQCDECQADHYWTTPGTPGDGCTDCDSGTFVDAGASNNDQSSCSPHDCGDQGKGGKDYDCVDCNQGYVQITALLSNVTGGEKECEYCVCN